MNCEYKENNKLKINIVGIIGGILALVSLVLPWWTLTVSILGSSLGTLSINVYTFQITALGETEIFPLSFWFGWLALALALVGGLIGIIVSFKINKSKLLAVGGIFAILSLVFFAVGWQLALSTMLGQMGLPVTGIGLFASASFAGGSYAAYLSFGFWIALVAAILMLAASRKTPKVAVAVPPPPPPAV